MSFPESFPAPLQQFLNTAYGTPTGVEPLGGKSGASVYRVRFAQLSLVVKHSASPREARFYTQTAHVLRANGIPLPTCHFSLNDSSGGWLVLEDIPHPLPRERWHGDPELIALLARLHRLPLNALSGDAAGFVPAWSADLTEQALAQFSPAASRQLRPALESARRAAQALFQPQAFISADPNPMNWGIRTDGTTVLFDWERFTRAAPAIDLAIVVGGLGSADQFHRVAQAYLAERPEYPQDAGVLAAHIAQAKLWTVIEFLGEYTSGSLTADTLLESLITRLPAWLAELGFTAS